MTEASLGLAMWVALSMGAAPASMQNSSNLGDSRTAPWAVGITDAQKAEAKRLFDLGTARLDAAAYEEAVTYFSQAVAHWDHPAIHFNWALALTSLLQPLECHKHLEAAMKYGPAPLGGEPLYVRAEGMLRRTEEKLARLSISCDTEGARITLDARKEPLVCPTALSEWVDPGSHHLRVMRQGFDPTDESFVLSAGEKREEKVRYRMSLPGPRWVSWPLLATGAVTAGAGFLLHRQAGNQYQTYDALVDNCSKQHGTSGCEEPSSEVIAARVSGDRLQQWETGAYVVAGLAMLGSATFFIFNRERQEFVGTSDQPKQGVSVVPLLGPSSGGALLTFQF